MGHFQFDTLKGQFHGVKQERKAPKKANFLWNLGAGSCRFAGGELKLSVKTTT
jgi:hypothetical protein